MIATGIPAASRPSRAARGSGRVALRMLRLELRRSTMLTMLPLLPRLVFLVVGPAVDVKLSAMQAGLFGRQFAIRFGPATFVVATAVATVVGLVFLGGAR